MSTRLTIPLLALLMLATVAPTRTARAADAKAAAGKAASPKDSMQAARARALKDGWPDTPAGLFAYAWVEAFSTGEKAMQSFLETHIRKESLEKRPMKERLATYSAMHEKLGALTLASVEKQSNPAELTAELLAEDASKHRFIFKVDPQPPHYLISVSTFDQRHGGHGGGGGHGH